MMDRGITCIDIIKTLAQNGFTDVADSILSLIKQRIAGDYLQTSAIFDADFNVLSAVNDMNDYTGPGTGYQISKVRWEEIKNIPNIINPSDY